jgi:hypothetical protein
MSIVDSAGGMPTTEGTSVDLAPIATRFYDPVKRYMSLSLSMTFIVFIALFFQSISSGGNRRVDALVLGVFAFPIVVGLVGFLYLGARGADSLILDEKGITFSFRNGRSTELAWRNPTFHLRFVILGAPEKNAIFHAHDPSWHNVFLDSTALDLISTYARKHGIEIHESQTLGLIGDRRKILTIERVG